MSVGYENGGKSAPAENETPDWQTLKGDVSEIADAAVARGRDFVDTARSQVTDYADKRKDDAAQSVADLASSLRESTKAFDDRPNIKAFVDTAAEGLDQLADSIRTRSVTDLYGEVEQTMRQRPGAVAAVTFAAGFFLARLIKASSDGARSEFASPQGRSMQDPVARASRRL
ncbi:MAG TPA: hypothetical protein VIL65_10360 [Beijerinckiaceae bacterium]|jgi:putative protein kinase ArgK-like GTPase of G3E family